MKRIILFVSIALLVIGFTTARVGDRLSTVDANGMVKDSILMPIGAILFMLGFVLLFIVLLLYLISFIRTRLKK